MLRAANLMKEEQPIKRKAFIRIALVVALVAAFAGFAWLSLPDLDQAHAPGAAQQTANGTGVVLAIDRRKGVVTISHEPLRELNMMAMTMGYSVTDKDLLSNLQPMQGIKFRLIYDGNEYWITGIN